MKGISLSLLAFLVFIGAGILLLRSRTWKRHFVALLIAFPAGLAVYLCGFALTPPDLFPPAWREPSAGVDFFNGLLAYILLFHGFWDTAYAAAITGFSTGLMIKIERSMPGGMTGRQLRARYAGAEGMDVAFARRIANLLRGGYVTRAGGSLTLTDKGRAAGSIARFFKKCLNVGEGG